MFLSLKPIKMKNTFLKKNCSLSSVFLLMAGPAPQEVSDELKTSGLAPQSLRGNGVCVHASAVQPPSLVPGRGGRWEKAPPQLS